MHGNRLRHKRMERNWTQAQVATAAGISRAAVSAIEGDRLVPSVEAALALAQVFGTTVEELFAASIFTPAPLQWAWEPTTPGSRFWVATVAGRRLAYPVETTASGLIEHDGVYCDQQFKYVSRYDPDQTLVLACCDPAASLLAAELARQAGYRAIILPRSSRRSLALLKRGVVHAAGLHLSTEQSPEVNARLVREELGAGYKLLRLARWEEGLALNPTLECRSIRQMLRAGLRIVGREEGSGARRCLDEVMGRRPVPTLLANSHHGVAEAIRCGWADAGPCLRLSAEDAGLSFLGVWQEIFELCYPAAAESDPRIRALISVVRSPACRRLYSELPGYETAETGELREVL